jgi:hypothetical protein
MIPVSITTIICVIILFQYYVNVPVLSSVASEIMNYGVVILAFAMCLGAVRIVQINVQQALKKSKRWVYSTLTVASTLLMLGAGLMPPIATNAVYLWLFTNVYAVLQGCAAGLLIFFITSSSYRAFRARSLESAALLIAGIFVLFTNAPIGTAMWNMFPVIGRWILDVPNTAGMRGIIIGIGISILVIGYRTLMGREKGYFGSETSGV